MFRKGQESPHLEEVLGERTAFMLRVKPKVNNDLRYLFYCLVRKLNTLTLIQTVIFFTHNPTRSRWNNTQTVPSQSLSKKRLTLCWEI